jgi:Zn-dependent protease with chaperone function
MIQGDPAISTLAKLSGGSSVQTAQGLSTSTIYAMAGFAVVIALGVFWWSNKKMKESMKRGVDTSPPPTFQYEERKHWADKFDEEKK